MKDKNIWIVSEDYENLIHPSIRKMWYNGLPVPKEIIINMWI